MEGDTMDLQTTAHERNAGLSFKSWLPVIGASMAVCLVLLTIFIIISNFTNFRSETNYFLNQSPSVPGGLGLSNTSDSAPAASDYQPVIGINQNLYVNYAPTGLFMMVGAILLFFTSICIFILAFKK